MTRLVGAVDQGTTSSRFIIFDEAGRPVASSQEEHRQLFPRPGWVEHDPLEIVDKTNLVIRQTLDSGGFHASDLAAVGITNQRETVVAWDRKTGLPFYNAIVWQDTRTADICERLAKGKGIDRFRQQTGLPLATYFSGPKMAWLLENVSEVKEAAPGGSSLLWHDRFLDPLQPHGRRPSHRCHQRLTHDASRPAFREMERRDV